MSWFTLQLDDTISFTTHPSSDITAWDQAIYPVLTSDNITTKQSYIPVTASCTTDSLISIHIDSNSTAIEGLCYYIERGDLSRLNDVLYIDTLIQSLTAKGHTLSVDLSPLPLVSLCLPMDYLLLGNAHSYYYKLINKVINDKGLKDNVSLTDVSLTGTGAYIQWVTVICEPITPQGILDTASLQLLKLIK